MDDFVLVVLSIVAVIILIKLGSIKRSLRRLTDIEDRLSELKGEVRKLTREHAPLPPAQAPVPQPTPIMTATVVPAPASVSVTPEAKPAATPPPIPARSVTVKPPPEPPAAPPQPSTFAQTVGDILNRIWQWILVGEEYRPQGVSMEYAVGTTWLMRVGIVALVGGVGYFLKWSMDHGLLGPMGRVAMSIAFGLGMLTGGIRLLGKRWNLLGQGFTGGGLATLYFSMYALGPLYHLVGSQPLVFGLMILVTLTAGVLALWSNSMLVAIFGIIGGFCTPVLLRTGEPRFMALYSYLFLLNLGVLGIGHLRQWRLLNYLSFVFTYVLFFLASPARYADQDVPVALAFLTLVFVTHSTLVLVYNLRRGVPATILEIAHLVLNAALFSWAAYDIIRDAFGRPYPALMTLAIAIYYVLHVVVFLRRRLADRPLLTALIALAGFYTTLTMPLIMEKESLTIAWALQALMLLWLGHRLNSAFLRDVAYVLYGLTFIRLAAFEFPRFHLAPAPALPLADYWHLLAARLWTFGSAIGSLFAAFIVEGRFKGQAPSVDIPDRAAPAVCRQIIFWTGLLCLFVYLHTEGYAMFGYAPLWRPAALTFVWCAMALAFLFLRLPVGSTTALAAVIFFAAGAIGKTLLVDADLWQLCERGYFQIAYTPRQALARWLDFGPVLAVLLLAWHVFRNQTSQPAIRRVFGYTTLFLLWLYTTLELNSLLHWKLREFQAGGISVLWTLFALAFVAGGIGKGVRPVRIAGLALFAIVVAKVLLIDLADMPTVYRVLALMIIGVLLLLGSFAYLVASKRFTKGTV